MLKTPRSQPLSRLTDAMLIVVAAALSYFPCLFNSFVYWDDDAHLIENPWATSPDWSAVPAIFQTVVNKTYVPLTILSFNLEYRLFGLHPFAFHLDNILLHAAVCLLIYRFIARLGFDNRTSFWTALLFAVHPVHVEAVAWVTARKDVLYSVFYLLAMHGYWSYLSDGKRRWYALSLLCAVLSMLAKPMALSLPLILGLLDWYKNKSFKASSAIALVPFAVVIAPIMWMTYSLNRTPMANPPFEAALIWIWSLAFYLQKFLWPWQLIPLYKTPGPVSLFNPHYALAVGTVFVFVIAAYRWRKNRVAVFSLLYFLFSIFFLLRISDVTKNLGPSIVADRFMYLPSLGFCLLAAYGVRHLKPPMQWMAPVVVGLMILRASGQCMVWRDDLSLWNSVIGQGQEIFLAYNSRGVAWAQRGQNDLALADLNKALALYPHYPRAFYNRGKVYAALQKNDEALADFDRAIEINPFDYKYFLERGILHSKRKELAQAIEDFNAALRLKPNDAGIFNNRGIVHRKMNETQAALDDFTRAIALKPNAPQAYINRANLWQELGRNDQATQDLLRARVVAGR